MDKKDNITTLIFDLGGVIVDLDWNHCVSNFKKIGVANMENLISTTLQRGFILDFELGNSSAQEFRNEIRKYISPEIVSRVTDDEIDAAWVSLLVSVPQEKIDTLIKLKKKYRMLMLSNTNSLSFERCVNVLFPEKGATVHDCFDKCYLSYQMHLCKPNESIFQALLDEEGIKAEECLFLDDGEQNIDTARKMGFNVRYVEPYTEFADWNISEILESLQ